MKIKELKGVREKTVEALKKEAGEIKAKIEKTRLELRIAKEKNLKKASNLTRDLSQILTIIREKEIISENKQINK
jgi:ribosomal protein L29